MTMIKNSARMGSPRKTGCWSRTAGGRSPSLREVGRLELDQARELSKQVALVVAQPPISQYDTPHELGECHLLTEIVLRGNQASELKVVERLGSLGFREPHQLGYVSLTESKPLPNHLLDVALLVWRELIVRMRQLQQQGAGGQLKAAVVRFRRCTSRNTISAK